MIALVGDFDAAVVAHRAIPEALRLAQAAAGTNLGWRWIGTDTIDDAPRQLADCNGIWAVPASPYRDMAGALAAIRFARESGRPFLGTCGGFQHALVEIARDVLALPAADHGETNPAGAELVVTALACSLVGTTGRIAFAPGSRIRAAYGADAATEGYRCSYGPAADYRARFEGAGLRFTAFDPDGAILAAEWEPHPFFVGTLFQPERAALRGEVPPLVRAFVQAAAAFRP